MMAITHEQAAALVPILREMPEDWQVAFIRHLYRLEADQPIYDSLVAMVTELGGDKGMAHAIADKVMKQVRH